MEEGDESISDLKQRKFHEALSQLHDKASSILLLTGQGKEISNYFNSVRNLIEGKDKELLSIQESVRERVKQVEKKEEEYELKEKELEKIQDLVRRGLDGMEEKRRELEGVKEFVEDKFREVEAREKEMEGKSSELEGMKQMVAMRLGDIEIKEKKLVEECKEIKFKDENAVERLKEIEMKEKEIQERYKGLELRETELEGKRKDLEGMKQMVAVRLGDIEIKEKKLVEECKEIKFKDENAVERLKEIEMKEKEIQERYKGLELRETELEGKRKDLEGLKQMVGMRIGEIEVKEKKFEEQREVFKLKDEKLVERLKEIQDRCKGLEVNEKKFDERCKEFKLRDLKVEEQRKVLKSKENQIEERCREVELERQRIMEKSKKLELKREFEEQDEYCSSKRRKSTNIQMKIEPKESHSIETATNSMDAKFCSSVTIDGKALQLFLNEHYKEHDSRRNEVEVVLRVSSDPALLVLNALEGFYVPHLKKGDLEFEGSIVRRSCILLLEQLMKISPEIQPHVKKQAINVASDWMNKMRLIAGHSLEVLGFLQLVASYGLASAFNSDKLLAYLWFISQHSKAPELFRILGFSDKISGFIHNLIGKKRRIAAVRFICAFDLVYEFPPGPLLKDHLNDSEIAVKRMSNSNKSLEAQTETTKERIADLKAVLRCIEDHSMESDFSPKELREQIGLLGKKISKRKRMLLNPDHVSQLPNPNEKKCLAHKDALAAAAPIIEHQFAANTDTKSPRSSSTAAPTATPNKRVAVTTPYLTAAPIKATSSITAAAPYCPTTTTSPSSAVAPITTISPTTTRVPTSSTTVTSSSPAIAPTSAPPKVKANCRGCNKRHQSQNQKGKKRLRVSRTPDVPRKPYFRDNGYVYSAQPRGQQPIDWFMNRGAPYLNRADRNHDLDGHLYRNSQLDPYYIDSMPYYDMPMPPWRY